MDIEKPKKIFISFLFNGIVQRKLFYNLQLTFLIFLPNRGQNLRLWAFSKVIFLIYKLLLPCCQFCTILLSFLIFLFDSWTLWIFTFYFIPFTSELAFHFHFNIHETQIQISIGIKRSTFNLSLLDVYVSIQDWNWVILFVRLHHEYLKSFLHHTSRSFGITLSLSLVFVVHKSIKQQQKGNKFFDMLHQAFASIYLTWLCIRRMRTKYFNRMPWNEISL